MLTAKLRTDKALSIEPKEILLTDNGYINHVGFANHDSGLYLSSAFQPIISIPHRRVVGFEALLRGHDEQHETVSTYDLLRMPSCIKEHLRLDRSCRWLHTHNYARQQQHDSWLFMNLNTQCLISERPDAGFMKELFDSSGIRPQQIVIEILEHQVQNIQYLRELIDHFRSLGCLIAIDDFGAGHSNFDRVWDLHPDIVKIDKNLVTRAAESEKVARMLNGIVSLIHEAGSLVVIEGVETELEAKVAISCSADMVQGFYFAKPNPTISVDFNLFNKIEQLQQQQNVERKQANFFHQQRFAQLKQLFEQSVQLLMGNGSFEQCGELLFKDERVVSAYLLNEQGFQIGKGLYSPNNSAQLDSRFIPLKSTDKSNWSHRHYHYRAIHNPGITQVSRPYHSVAGSHMCVTVSQAFSSGGQGIVLCCDLEWSDEQTASL